jgi:hypothetical protein
MRCSMERMNETIKKLNHQNHLLQMQSGYGKEEQHSSGGRSAPVSPGCVMLLVTGVGPAPTYECRGARAGRPTNICWLFCARKRQMMRAT